MSSNPITTIDHNNSLNDNRDEPTTIESSAASPPSDIHADFLKLLSLVFIDDNIGQNESHHERDVVCHMSEFLSSCEFIQRYCVPNVQSSDSFFANLERNNTDFKGAKDRTSYVEELWSTIECKLKEIVTQNPFRESVDDHQRGSFDDEANETRKENLLLPLLSFLDVINNLCMDYLQFLTKKKDTNVNEMFLRCAVLLHDLLLIVNSTNEGIELQSKISLLCERVYLAFPENDIACDTVPNNIVYLLSESLLLSAKKSLVKRVYKMRSALDLLDYSQSTVLHDILLRTVISPLYLSTKEGIKFLAYAFNVDPSLPPLFHSAIVPQIPQANETTIKSYGELYFKSWRGSQAQSLLQIEHNCIQDLMFHAIHARNPTLFSNLRLLLNAFHEQKNQAGVDEVLLRLYEPILFRSLNVANSLVRRNATCIFVDVFPLRDPELNKEDAENLFQKQIGLLKEVLIDDCPFVRVAAVEGLCKILTLYWEVFSSDDCFSLLKQLVAKLAYDANSINVRVSVCRGLAYLLDNHLSHHVLKKLLPKLGSLINDNSALVRSSLISLLLRIRTVRSIEFDSVVSEESLLDRLVVDSEQIKVHISSLLLNSYFPYNQAQSEILERVLNLVSLNAHAAKQFYRYVLESVPDSAPAKLIKTINKLLQKCMKTTDETERSQEDSKYVKIAQDVSLVGDLIEILSNTFSYMTAHLNNTESLEFLRSEFTSIYLRDLNIRFPTLHIASQVWAIARFLPQESMDVLISDAMFKLEQMCKSGSLRTDYEYIFECIVGWGYEDKLLSLIHRYHDIHIRKIDEPRQKRQKVSQNDEAPLKTRVKQSMVALALLHCTLKNEKLCTYLMKSKKILDSICTYQYGVISEVLTKYIATNEEAEIIDRETYEMYMSMILHTHSMVITRKMLQPLRTKKFQKKKRKDQDQLFAKMNQTIPTDIHHLLVLFIKVIIPTIMESSDNFGLEVVEELSIQSVKSGKEYKIDFYPLGVTILKSICSFINEWIQVGIIRFGNDEVSDDQNPQTLLTSLFDSLCNPKMRPILQYILPDLLKSICMIQNQHVFEFPVQLLSQLLFSAPEFFIPSLSPPVIHMKLEEETPGLGIKYPKSVRSKIERAVNHRRDYIQQILLNSSNAWANVIYLARILLQSCFNALQESSDQSEVSPYHAISLSIDLVHELTLHKRKKNTNQCITAFSSELCNWLQKICDNLGITDKEEHETAELMLCIVLDLCALVLNKFTQLLEQHQQSLMKRLLAKLKLDLPMILSPMKDRVKFEETRNKIQHLTQLCTKNSTETPHQQQQPNKEDSTTATSFELSN